ncbi:MAG: tol-pal system protein YbgF [Bacteroidia bacterium]|jgi:tol-pal system protein YbgF
MQHVSKLLAASGLVLMTGPLSFLAQAQPDYVDVEAERAAAEVAGRPAGASSDPYGPRPAQSYPATSYGVGGVAAPAPVAAAPTASRSGQAGSANLGNLFYQLQQMQQEVMQLNGKVEEQAYAIRQLEEQSMQRYMDLDKRLSGGAGASAGVSTGTSGAISTASAPSPGSKMAASQPAATSGVEVPGEADGYRAAYALVQGRQFESAVPAFQQFLQAYPAGKYAANAHYWLGELYLVVQPRSLEASRQSFALLLSEYPEHPKAPDALYKLGKVQFEKGNREKAREYLDLVIRQYQSASPDVARLAREFINENY